MAAPEFAQSLCARIHATRAFREQRYAHLRTLNAGCNSALQILAAGLVDVVRWLKPIGRERCLDCALELGEAGSVPPALIFLAPLPRRRIRETTDCLSAAGATTMMQKYRDKQSFLERVAKEAPAIAEAHLERVVTVNRGALVR